MDRFLEELLVRLMRWRSFEGKGLVVWIDVSILRSFEAGLISDFLWR
jgi:hypothetical protein